MLSMKGVQLKNNIGISENLFKSFALLFGFGADHKVWHSSRIIKSKSHCIFFTDS
jgi:hypothetical protein